MATYDTDGNGIVDDSEKLGGVAANQYALKTDIPEVPEKAADSDKLGGVAASEYALKTDIPEKAADSDKLGGVAASEYALKTDIPEIPTYTMSATDDGNGNVTISIGG